MIELKRFGGAPNSYPFAPLFFTLAALLVLGGEVVLLLLSSLRFPLDRCCLLRAILPNTAGHSRSPRAGPDIRPHLALHHSLTLRGTHDRRTLAPTSVPIALHQAALVVVAVLTSIWFTMLTE
jgi:presenilin 1